VIGNCMDTNVNVNVNVVNEKDVRVHVLSISRRFLEWISDILLYVICDMIICVFIYLCCSSRLAGSCSEGIYVTLVVVTDSLLARVKYRSMYHTNQETKQKVSIEYALQFGGVTYGSSMYRQ